MKKKHKLEKTSKEMQERHKSEIMETKGKVNLRNRTQGIYIGGIPHPRLYWKKGKGVKCPSVIIKCGDCDNKIEVSYGFSPKEKRVRKTVTNDPGIEINGVFAPTKFWKAFFKKIGL